MSTLREQSLKRLVEFYAKVRNASEYLTQNKRSMLRQHGILDTSKARRREARQRREIY